LETARRVWVRLTQGRAGTLRRTGWRHYIDPAGSSIGMPAYLDAYRERLAPAAARLARVSLECRPALDLIASYGAHGQVLLYVDPPYLGATRASTNYRCEMPHADQHRELATALRAVAAAVVVSGYPSDLYDLELYPDWHRTTITTGTGQGHRWATRTEVLWSNRPLTTQPELFEPTVRPHRSVGHAAAE
jgi:DNA adenine methylase